MKIRQGRWWHGAILAGWIAAIVAAAVYLARPVTYPPPPPGWTIWREPAAVRALAIAPDGVLCGGLRGVFRLDDDGTAVAVDVPGLLAPPAVNALLADTRGYLWVAHDEGLAIRGDAGWTMLAEADGLPRGRVLALAETPEGFVWCGTAGGLIRLPVGGPWDAGHMLRMTTKDGLLHDRIFAIVRDTEGGLWFGTYAAPDGGLSRWKDGRWSHWTLKEGLPHPNVTSLMLARDGRIWAGCGFFDEGGAAIFSGESGTWRLVETIPTKELAGPKVRSLLEDRDGRIWLGAEKDGLTIRQGRRTLRILTPADGLPSWEVTAIAQTGDGAIWLATLSGAVRISAEAVNALLGAPPGRGEGAHE